MIPDKLIQEVRDKLEKSENPLFFFDDDHDGLTSFLLLFRKYKKGHGIMVPRNEHSDEFYLRKIDEYHADLVLTLDKPTINQTLIDQVKVPFIIVDHHPVLDVKGIKYVNPRIYDENDTRCTSYWSYQIANNKEDSWLAATGIVADFFIPDKDFMKDYEYPELIDNAKEPPEALFTKPIGTLIKVFASCLKGKTSEVRKCISILRKLKNPYEILRQESKEGKFLWNRFVKINKGYEVLLHKALSVKPDKNIYMFNYETFDTSFTGQLSTELAYRINAKVFIIAREANGDVRMSIRGKGVKVAPILAKALKEIPGHGGGHDYACGASVKKEDFDKFIELFKKAVN